MEALSPTVFSCPTRVIHCHDFAGCAGALIGDRSWSLITSVGWRNRGAVAQLTAAVRRPPRAVLLDIASNPQLKDVLRAAPRVHGAEVLLALGGGSVIDATKAMVAAQGVSSDADLAAILKEGKALNLTDPLPEILAIPTTAGTGAEVTRWGTVWDRAAKLSVQSARLYPSYAILDAELCRSMPAELILSSGLDAAAHAMEAVWNSNHTPLSDILASDALATLRELLGVAVHEGMTREVASRIQTAALLAGLAMSTTQTALAHSISYPLTGHFGVPHGLACGFTLAAVAEFNMATDQARLAPIARAFAVSESELPRAIRGWLNDLGAIERIQAYVTREQALSMGDELINPARAGNNIRACVANDACEIVYAAWMGWTQTRRDQSVKNDWPAAGEPVA
jgi:alcohol dehydrogenase